jgi:TonB family protein
MAPELHGRVRTLFDAALELPEAERRPFLQSSASDDPEVLLAVLRLLEAHRGSQSFLEADTSSTWRIGRYLVTAELGRGAMGVVYEAIDPLIGRRIAVKVIRLQSFADGGEARFLRERLFREARSAGSLSHPGIVVVFDVGQEGDLAFIAMERVEGPSLYQVLASGRKIPRAEAFEILRQAAVALDYAHRNGVVHRDIKPANIMLDKGVTVKVADFGIAKITSAEHHTVTSMVMGTPSYMSPEQIEALPADGRSDQFSLAVVAYELLTGRRPFQADSLATLAHMIVYADRPSARGVNPGLPPAVDDVLRRSLARFPKDRYPRCIDFVAAPEAASNDIWRPPLNAQSPVVQPKLAALASGGGKDRRAPTPIRYVLGGVALSAVITGILLHRVFPLRPAAAPVVEKQPAVPPGAQVTLHRKSNKTGPREIKDSNPKPEGGSGVKKQIAPLAGAGILDPGAVYQPGVDVSEPVVLSKVDPEYTAVARKLHVHGIVVLKIVVQPDGTARDFRVTQPLGYGLDEKAIEAIHRWRFQPGMKDGNAVSVRATVDAIFRPLVAGGGAEWESGAMDFPVEAGLTPPVVEDGTLPGPGSEVSADDVVLAFTVTSSGSVKNIQAIGRSQSVPDLLSRSLAAWRFRPARKGTRSVEATGTVRFVKSRGAEDARLALSPPVPQGNPPKPDTSALSAGATLTPLNPATVDDTFASSPGSPATAALIEFVNRSSRAVDIYWIDYQGNRVPFHGPLQSGANWFERTFLKNAWLVVVSGTGGTTAKDTGVRLAGFEAVTPNPSRDPAKRDIAIITDPASATAATNVPGSRSGNGTSSAKSPGANAVPSKTLELLRQAANRGDPQAMVELGEAYMEDNGSEAALWFRKAADMGNPSAMLYLAGIYELGSGVRQDYGLAAQWYSKAAGAGNADAMYNLGRMYENGQGVAKDLNHAYKFYVQAAGLGNVEAKAKLARLKGNQK